MATIETFNQMDANQVQHLDIRHVLSGNPPAPEEDILRFLCETMNAIELDQDRNLDELEALDSGGEGDAASVKSQEPPEILQTEQELEIRRAAEAELKSLGREAMDAAAAEVAEKLVRGARAGGADEQLLFNLTEGRREPAARQVSARPWGRQL